MPISMDCKEPGCDERIYFEQQRLPAMVLVPAMGKAPDQPASDLVLKSNGRFSVYLECPTGHRHKYWFDKKRPLQ